jgi:hypothetical protein
MACAVASGLSAALENDGAGGIRSIFRFHREKKSTAYRSGCQRDFYRRLVLRDRTCRW